MRAEAARLAGMERQALRDAVVRYNAEGLAGLHDRPRPGAWPRLDEARRAALRRMILDGPDMEATGLSAWTLGELCREVESRLVLIWTEAAMASDAGWRAELERWLGPFRKALEHPARQARCRSPSRCGCSCRRSGRMTPRA